MIRGTAYFPTISAAVSYYRPYGYSNTLKTVKRKIKEGSIHIGEPPTKPDEFAYLVNEKPGQRYYVETLEQS
tara:strand:- start:140 stop:355 length:216 start_codon:yes stop_codon:yes gene_type:complete